MKLSVSKKQKSAQNRGDHGRGEQSGIPETLREGWGDETAEAHQGQLPQGDFTSQAGEGLGWQGDMIRGVPQQNDKVMEMVTKDQVPQESVLCACVSCLNSEARQQGQQPPPATEAGTPGSMAPVAYNSACYVTVFI